MGRFDRFSATSQMRARGIPKWGYGPITGCVLLFYSALNLLGSGLYLFLYDHWRGPLDHWIVFSEPLVKLTAHFFPAVDSFETELIRVSRYWTLLSREAEIPVLRNIVAMNSLLFVIFLVPIIIVAPLEARRAVRRYGVKILENAEGVLQHPTDYGLRPYAHDAFQRWLMSSTGVHTKEIGIAGFAVIALLLCYYGSDYVATNSFILGFRFGLFATSGLYWLTECLMAVACFLVPATLFSMSAKTASAR